MCPSLTKQLSFMEQQLRQPLILLSLFLLYLKECKFLLFCIAKILVLKILPLTDDKQRKRVKPLLWREKMGLNHRFGKINGRLGMQSFLKISKGLLISGIGMLIKYNFMRYMVLLQKLNEFFHKPKFRSYKIDYLTKLGL